MNRKDLSSNRDLRIRKRIYFSAASLLGVALLGLGLLTFWPDPPEPVFERKSLSQWLGEISVGNTHQQRLLIVSGHLLGGYPEQMRAIKGIGTNALPLYLKWLSYKPGPLQRTRGFLQAHASSFLRIAWQPSDKEALRARTAVALVVLGDEATPAIPDLCRIALSQSGSEPTYQYTTRVLGTLAKPKRGYLRSRFNAALNAHLSALLESPEPQTRVQTTNLVDRLANYQLGSSEMDILW
jgi:hypothetical protein